MASRPARRALGAATAAAVRRLGSILIRERDRWVLWSAVGFGLGIGIYFALPFEPPMWIGPSLAGVTGLAAVLSRARPAPLLISAGAVAIVAAGFAAAQVRAAMVATPLLERRIGPTIITGEIERFESLTNGSRIVIADVGVAELARAETPQRVRISLRGQQPAMKAGDTIRVRGVLMPLPAPSAPGAFDFQRQSFFQGLGAVGFAYGRATVTREARGSEGLPAAIARARQRIGERIDDHLKDATGAVAVALMTGERGAIPAPVMTAIRDSGLAHLLAISGLHMGLMAGVLFAVSRGLLALVPTVALRYPIKKIAAVMAIAGAAAYAALTGANVPAQRALLMVGLVMLAVILDRRGLSMRGVAWAAIVILALSPESLVSVSFQLSFAAVVALIAVYEGVSELRRRRGDAPGSGPGRVALYLGGVALTTLVAGAATAPFAAFHFNQFAGYGLAANLIAVPITALWVMPWAVAAFALMPFGLELLALAPMGWGIDLVIRVALAVSSWPGAVSRVPAMPGWSIVAITLGGLWLCLWQTAWRYAGIAMIAVGLAGLLTARPPDLLIDADGTLAAIRTADGNLTFSTLRANRFSREAWLRRYSQSEEGLSWAAHGASDDGVIACDSAGCVTEASGYVIALARRPEALADDCWMADIVLSLVPVEDSCPRPRAIIDRVDLWRDGAHAIWLSDRWLGHRRITIKSVNAHRGERPWVVRPTLGDRL